LIPENVGGLGLSEIDFVLIAESCGYYGLPEPLVEHAGVSAPLLAATGAAPELMHLAAAGKASLAIGHPINPFVTDADSATELLLENRGEIHLVSALTTSIVREPTLDPLRRVFNVHWTPSPATRIASAADGRTLWDAALDRGALFAAAQCLGLAQRMVDLALAYAKERKQFGKVIGSYQAVKHQLANVQVKIEFARPVVYAAAADLAAHDRVSRARVSHAKIVATEAANLGSRSALQVFGAIGYSWEADLHLFLKRALALTYAWGTPDYHRERVAARVLDLPVGPEHTFSREHHHA
jgi:hypothetical protein